MYIRGQKVRIYTLHYNKPASKKAGKPQITVHYAGKCHIVDNVACSKLAWWGHINKRQPVWVMKGKCNKMEIIDGIAYIT